MKVLIIGAAGMVGHNLTESLLSSGKVGDRDITELSLFDVISADSPSTARAESDIDIRVETGDISNLDVISHLVEGRPDLIFHLAAIVSGEAEADFEKGYRINLDGTRHLFEAIRAQSDYYPRVVYTSSIAVFGAPFPDAIGDEFITAPMTSYGTQKMIGELLLNDYSRRNIFDGVGIRLPTIVVRPGKPNKAASGFFSGIIREPLAGQEAVLPVEDDVRHWVASPASATGFLLHAATMSTAELGARRCLTMPGLSVTVGEMVAALEEVAGSQSTARIKREADPAIRDIVAGWPRNFEASRAVAAGFQADSSFQDIIRAHMRDTGLLD